MGCSTYHAIFVEEELTKPKMQQLCQDGTIC